MEQLYFQQVYEELEVVRNYMDSLFQQIQESSPILLLPSSDEPSRKLLPGVQDNLLIQLVESKDEIVVSAKMISGDLKRDITIDLIHSMALKISCVRRGWKKEDKTEYTLCEHSFGYISQIIPFPKPVTIEGTRTSFKNGILEVHLKKRDKSPES
jgi:HSP20 family protein